MRAPLLPVMQPVPAEQELLADPPLSGCEDAPVIVERVTCPRGTPTTGWPWDVPAVAQLVTEGISFGAPITFLVGENGSGKSTVVEAVAEAYGLDARGGRAGRKYGNLRPKTPLGEVLRLDYTRTGSKMATGPRARKRGYFLRAETAFGLAEAVTGLPGYWQDDVAAMSHGEGFIAILDAMFAAEPGLYLMDEPEAALSFTACLRLVSLLDQLAAAGGQVVCATHSPVLAALPGAQILELGEDGITASEWSGLTLVDHWRRFLARPDGYLGPLLDEG